MNICRELRDAMDLTMRELALKAGMSASTIQIFEAGGRVSDKSINKLADFFNVTTNELKGEATFDADKWLDKMTKPAVSETIQEETQEMEPIVTEKPLELHQLDIKHIIRASSAAANYYLEEGWILLDTMSDKGTFYCLLGNKRFHTSEDFERLKRKQQATRQPSYWMSK